MCAIFSLQSAKVSQQEMRLVANCSDNGMPQTMNGNTPRNAGISILCKAQEAHAFYSTKLAILILSADALEDTTHLTSSSIICFLARQKNTCGLLHRYYSGLADGVWLQEQGNSCGLLHRCCSVAGLPDGVCPQQRNSCTGFTVA